MNYSNLPGKERRVLPLYIGVALAFSLGLTAAQAAAQPSEESDQRHGEDHDHDVLEEVVVTATPINRNVVELTQNSTVLSGEALNRELASNIGDTLSRMPGLSNASFGQNVGRPVIRGQQGVRIGVLNDGMSSFDASAVSQDHAVPTEPFIADRIEVLRGPTTLLYGSGAIGGVTNIVTNTIPVEVPEDGFEGRVMLQGDTAADERLGSARLDFGLGNFAFHANGFVRRTDDYEIPGFAELYPEDEDHEEGHDEDHEEGHEEEEVFGVLENSFLDNEGGALGGAWIGENWRAGLSWSAYDSDYGLPGGHAHEHGEEEHEGEDHEEHEEEEEEFVTIGLESRRIDGVLHGTNPFSGFSEFDLKISDTDYTHTEFEGAEVGTLFDSQTTDLRLELVHNTWDGFDGAFGLQWSDNDFSALGEEAFVPPSETETWGLFWVESFTEGNWTMDFGVRYEDTQIDSFLIEHGHEDEHEDEHEEEGEHEDEAPMPASRSFNPFSGSLGILYHLNESSHFSFNLSRAERAPASVELFSNGPHIATQTFEVGNPDLKNETNTHFEGAYRVHKGALTGSLTIYHDDFGDYIYLADTGEMEDGFPERIWSQQDAEFTGGELEVRWDVGRHNSGHWQIFGFYDQVKATLEDGSPVPRIPPKRLGLGVDWDFNSLAANVTWITADDQNRTADFETATPGYDLLNAEFSWLLPVGDSADVELYVQGRNLLDEDIRNSTSYIKDQAPQIGRNIAFGIRSTF